MAAQLIPLSVWAETIFGEHKPHRNTLMNWIRNGRIRPVPRKVGREYLCKPNAEYVDPVTGRIERMANCR